MSHHSPFQPGASFAKDGKGTSYVLYGAVMSTDPYSTLDKRKRKILTTSNSTQAPMPPYSEASHPTKPNHFSQRKSQPTLSKSMVTKGTSHEPSSKPKNSHAGNLDTSKPLKPLQTFAPFCFLTGIPFLNTLKLTTPSNLFTLSHHAMGNMDQ